MSTTTLQRSGGALVCSGGSTVIGFFPADKLAFSVAHRLASRRNQLLGNPS
jgi:hypothetical protein